MQLSADDLAAIYRDDRRRHDDGRPWVVVNMIASIDGAVALDGVSGGLGGEADRAVFRTLRGHSDVILVAAGTVRAEGYRPPRVDPATSTERAGRGQADLPVVAVVTRSLDLDLDGELFATPGYRPTVVTVGRSDPARRAEVARVADVVVAGEAHVDPAEAVTTLARRHGPVVLAEGGPTLNGALTAADVVHELCVTVSPMVVGGDGGRMVRGPSHPVRGFDLDRALVADDLVFLRYLRER